MNVLATALGVCALIGAHLLCCHIDRKRGTCAWRVTWLAFMAGVLAVLALEHFAEGGWQALRGALELAGSAWFVHGAIDTERRHRLAVVPARSSPTDRWTPSGES